MSIENNDSKAKIVAVSTSPLTGTKKKECISGYFNGKLWIVRRWTC
jgi:hypothetical protein